MYDTPTLKLKTFTSTMILTKQATNTPSHQNKTLPKSTGNMGFQKIAYQPLKIHTHTRRQTHTHKAHAQMHAHIQNSWFKKKAIR